ncbi:MAG: hypothetical protein ACREMQ_22595 [Longimicrobiales bacterium]
MLSKVGIPELAVVFRNDVQPAPISHTLRQVQPDSVLQGGWQVRGGGGVCSLGFPARRVSDHMSVFVTASHCTDVLDGDDVNGGVLQPGPGGNPAGDEVEDREPWLCSGWSPHHCRNSDAALIQALRPLDLGKIARTTEAVECEECFPTVNVDDANPTLTVVGRLSYVIENEMLYKIGRTTGWTYGVVEDTCTDHAFLNAWRLCSDRIDVRADTGDSGGPVFSLSLPSYQATLRGIVYARSCCIVNDSYMSNLGQIEADLGALNVYDPGPPQVTINGPTVIPPGQYCTWNATVSYGISPFTFQWSALFSGSGQSVSGVPSGSGWLTVQVTDWDGRQDTENMYVTVQGQGPPMCDP